MRGVFPHLEPGVPADLQTNLSYHCIIQNLCFYKDTSQNCDSLMLSASCILVHFPPM